LQGFEHSRIEFGIFAAEHTHGFAAAGCDTVLVHRGTETGFVHIQVLFAGDVARDFKGQAIGGVEVKGLTAVENGFLLTR
jgi:hypothetical protein